MEIKKLYGSSVLIAPLENPFVQIVDDGYVIAAKSSFKAKVISVHIESPTASENSEFPEFLAEGSSAPDAQAMANQFAIAVANANNPFEGIPDDLKEGDKVIVYGAAVIWIDGETGVVRPNGIIAKVE